MEDTIERHNTLIGVNLADVDDLLVRHADRLGGAPTAVAGFESGTPFWGLSLFHGGLASSSPKE